MGLNAFLNYSIETKDGNVPFRIDSSTGCVFVHTMKPLDYEKTPFYNFSIRVSSITKLSLMNIASWTSKSN